MNFINCAAATSQELFHKAVIFWSENSYQHISSLLKSPIGTTAVLGDYFKEQLKKLYDEYKEINQIYKQSKGANSRHERFLRINRDFITLLERIKFEGFSGYPILQQSVFHYIYEQRYINAIFQAKNMVGNVLITEYFVPFYSQNLSCFYQQMYFWSIIAAMHPSLLMGNNAFYNSINGYSKEFLTGVTNSFNKINFELSSLKRPIKKSALTEIFNQFCELNAAFLEFLMLVRQNSVKIFTSPTVIRLNASFYGTVDHMIKEHTLVSQINGNISKVLK